MEIMKRDHEIGVLLWALDKEKEDAKREARFAVERLTKGSKEEKMMVQVPDIQLTRATLYEGDHTPQDDGYEILNSPMIEKAEESYPEILSEKARPLSIISIASGRFGFPIPPSRPSFNSPTQDDQIKDIQSGSGDDHGHEFDDAETECDHDSSFGHEPDYQAVNRNLLLPYQITIYPPGQNNGTAGTDSQARYPSSPHTPHRSTDFHSHSTTRDHEHDRLPFPMMRRITPLSARRSKPDLTIPIPRRPSSRRPAARRQATSPLRLAVPKVKVKTRSLQPVAGSVISSQEKFLRARESRLEDVCRIRA